MKKENELWIGDWVKLKKTGHRGKYEGINKDGRVRVNTKGKIILTSFKNLEVIDEPKPETDINLLIDPKSDLAQKEKELPLGNCFDLHIEVLAPEQQHLNPNRILDFQIAKCKLFIEKCISTKKQHIEIIHGKGAGILKAEVIHLLRSYPEVKFIIPARHGGAQEVWLLYNKN